MDSSLCDPILNLGFKSSLLGDLHKYIEHKKLFPEDVRIGINQSRKELNQYYSILDSNIRYDILSKGIYPILYIPEIWNLIKKVRIKHKINPTKLCQIVISADLELFLDTSCNWGDYELEEVFQSKDLEILYGIIEKIYETGFVDETLSVFDQVLIDFERWKHFLFYYIFFDISFNCYHNIFQLPIKKLLPDLSNELGLGLKYSYKTEGRKFIKESNLLIPSGQFTDAHLISINKLAKLRSEQEKDRQVKHKAFEEQRSSIKKENATKWFEAYLLIIIKDICKEKPSPLIKLLEKKGCVSIRLNDTAHHAQLQRRYKEKFLK